MEAQITNLERQMADAEGRKDQAQRARQDCNQQAQGLLAALKAANCVLGETNYQNAQQQIRQLQVEISSKQRELQRLNRSSY